MINTFQSTNPATQEKNQQSFTKATHEQIQSAIANSVSASNFLRESSGKSRAQLLRQIADNIENLGDTLVEMMVSESGLPAGRAKGERGRTCGQLRMFADLIDEGSWVNAVIDLGNKEKSPPKSDIRLMKRPVGPVVVFTASNFPLAFSTAGGDTASALASGCPVIVKAHPSHPGTNSLTSKAIKDAVKTLNFPAGTYSTLYDDGHDVGKELVMHPHIKSVAFTGSMKGGMAIHKLAQSREEPIPVFSEMGSINPVFIGDKHLAENPQDTAKMIANSANMGAGQFCTNPGIQIVNKGHAKAYTEALSVAFSELKAFTMLNEGIHKNYIKKRSGALTNSSVSQLFAKDQDSSWTAPPAVATIDAADFISKPALHEEVFGPFSLVVICDKDTTMEDVARSLSGQLTGTIIGTDEDLKTLEEVYKILENRVGRIVFNNVPTGVDVCHAMHHGGPFPAATDSRFTSVGADAIYRFVRPVCYQDCPDFLLPEELKSSNPLEINRKVDGKMTLA